MELVVCDDATDAAGGVGEDAIFKLDLGGERGVMDGSDKQAQLAVVGVDASWRGGLGRRDTNLGKFVGDAESDEREEECEEHGGLH